MRARAAVGALGTVSPPSSPLFRANNVDRYRLSVGKIPQKR